MGPLVPSAFRWGVMGGMTLYRSLPILAQGRADLAALRALQPFFKIPPTTHRYQPSIVIPLQEGIQFYETRWRLRTHVEGTAYTTAPR